MRYVEKSIPGGVGRGGTLVYRLGGRAFWFSIQILKVKNITWFWLNPITSPYLSCLDKGGEGCFILFPPRMHPKKHLLLYKKVKSPLLKHLDKKTQRNLSITFAVVSTRFRQGGVRSKISLPTLSLIHFQINYLYFKKSKAKKIKNLTNRVVAGHVKPVSS